jgi:hypothetical protein
MRHTGASEATLWSILQTRHGLKVKARSVLGAKLAKLLAASKLQRSAGATPLYTLRNTTPSSTRASASASASPAAHSTAASFGAWPMPAHPVKRGRMSRCAHGPPTGREAPHAKEHT